ncbi:probable splicing factor YJU2B [Podarcis raffonei]|uniref:probable splicing factor YJU2B n=1 Tax=Podarcis raffonei TaxID=65483 RepID=UPI002329702E|nr:probable splicing factor YJU2B [Podarcis raffonei]XP_053226896.1 probable splicing factor YJU2B [Podarcis raffonei]XP_053226897.1 probable splicing factor YJU2B [Podarcis raffonei]XP_053226898.1 probable splicing factor YJU2B [Podarcis raffonei]
MGERKGVNKYYPPDFDPAKHGSLNKYRNSHPLRERARKLSQGILIIRFEMPYNIWCDGCQNHIGMGVRYNAEKKKVGNYYTTPIYRFRMKCHLCPNHIEMQTDPANCDYVIVSGARRKEERWDVEANEQIVATAHEEKQKLETDAMYRLEHGSKDQSKLQRALPTLQNIQEAQSAWKDDFALNSRLRRKFREEKKVLQEEEKKDLALQSKACLSIPLVRESDEDRHLAALLKYQSLGSYEDKQKQKRSEIVDRPWFSSAQVSSPKANDTLKKLALSGKSPAGKTPVAMNDLGVVRRKSRDRERASAEEESEASDPTSCVNTQDQDSAVKKVSLDSLTGPEVGSQKAEGSPLSHFSTSLVADYSDSASDPEAEL